MYLARYFKAFIKFNTIFIDINDVQYVMNIITQWWAASQLPDIQELKMESFSCNL